MSKLLEDISTKNGFTSEEVAEIHLALAKVIASGLPVDINTDLVNAFPWSDTCQGLCYWSAINQRIATAIANREAEEKAREAKKTKLQLKLD